MMSKKAAVSNVNCPRQVDSEKTRLYATFVRGSIGRRLFSLVKYLGLHDNKMGNINQCTQRT